MNSALPASLKLQSETRVMAVERTDTENKTLSENRAKSVMNAIVAGGISAARLTAAGLGQTVPVADNRTEEGCAKNRLVELVKNKFPGQRIGKT